MPWSADSFAKHNRGLSPSVAKKAAKVASAILRRTGDEGLAIATSNKLIARKTGGLVPWYLGDGGLVRPAEWDQPSIWDQTKPAGLLKSTIPGRTDHIAVSPEADSYVIPADVVSGVGEGNTEAGGKILEDALKQFDEWDPGEPVPSIGLLGRRASGGRARVPILAAGGEFVVSPRRVLAIGGGDATRGHRELDRLVKSLRAKTIKTMSKLPGPVT